jgi:hypothetical protein
MQIKLKIANEIVDEFFNTHEFERVCIIMALGNKDNSLSIFDYLNVTNEFIEKGNPLEYVEK